MKVLVLRPEPGASETAARARALGLEPVTASLFHVKPIAWEQPEAARFDAVLLTSANAARQGGLSRYAELPCFAVGEATATAALLAGFTDVRTGRSDGAAALTEAAEAGARRVLHPCGRDHLPLEQEGVTVERHVVYAAEAVSELSAEAAAALEQGAIALLHSPRAAALFATLVPDRTTITIAAISPAAAAAAGPGWSRVAAAPRPRDEALLELARHLCQTKGGKGQQEAG